jgi:hypothetical protein
MTWGMVINAPTSSGRPVSGVVIRVNILYKREFGIWFVAVKTIIIQIK